jgi:hypothetical protein
MQIFVKLQNYTTMKKLQNNFTTTEQSKRLLELGVPADSADLFYSKFECETFENRPTLCYDKKYSDIVPDGYEKDYLPCWSAGRLIEIYQICVSRGFCFNVCFTNIMNEIIYKIAEAKSNGWCFFYKFAEEYEN